MINIGHEGAKAEMQLQITKYKKKVETLKARVKELEDESNAKKLKELEKPNQRNYRLELEKS